ncbi:hypothetical protein GF325_16875 [Candidatus Bathyarchaeota archaeon]|nr:hypothetical protein [Candidatus Bathyarchaeota archaeon]
MPAEFTIFDWINAFIQLVTIPLMMIIYGRKIMAEREKTGTLNRIKLIIFLAFTLDLYSVVVEDLLFLGGVIPMKFYEQELVLGLNHLSTGIMVTLGLYFIMYLLDWRVFKYSSVYFFLGILIYFGLTGRDFLYQPFCYVGGVIGVFSLFVVALKIRDDGPLGLSIMYLIALLSLVLEEIAPLDATGIPVMVASAGFIFGLFFVAGYFKPFTKRAAKRGKKLESIPKEHEVIELENAVKNTIATKGE